MTAEYITREYTEAMKNLAAAFEAEDAAKFKYQKREAWEDQEFWGNKAANMIVAARKFGVELPA